LLIPFYASAISDREKQEAAAAGLIETVTCRFRSLGCIPCTGAVASNAKSVDDIIAEVIHARRSERENRIIDLGSDAAMEQKKKEGYF
jgi:sulfate adenylyltransferase subunit 2